MTENENKVIEALKDGPLSSYKLLIKSGLSITNLYSAIANLEISSLITSRWDWENETPPRRRIYSLHGS